MRPFKPRKRGFEVGSIYLLAAQMGEFHGKSNPWKIAHRRMRLEKMLKKLGIESDDSLKCTIAAHLWGELRDQWLSHCCYWGPRFSHWLRLLLIKLHIGYSPICKRCEPSYGKPKNKDPLLDSLYNPFLVIYGYWVDHMGFFSTIVYFTVHGV